MTSRERVQAALAHKETDRPPIDFGGHRSSGIMAIAYRKLKQALEIDAGDIYVYDVVQQLAIVEPEVMDRFEVDTVELGRGFCLDASFWRDWELPDGSPCKIPAWINPEKIGKDWVIRGAGGEIMAVMKEGSLYFEQALWPLASGYHDVTGPDAIDRATADCMWCAVSVPPGPAQAGSHPCQILKEGALRLRESGDRAVVALFGGNLLEMGQFLRRNENFLYDLAAKPTLVHDFLDKLMELHLSKLERFCAALADSADVILFGDDLGMQTGPQISPEMYREFFKPRHKILFETAKRLSGARTMLHCCGGIYELLPDLIDTGLDAVNPVQTSCRNMEPWRLKREFGRDMTFWGGGCDTRDVLPRALPPEVRDHVRERVRTMARGGGFVFQQVHNVMADVPPDNVIAMLDAARDALG